MPRAGVLLVISTATLIAVTGMTMRAQSDAKPLAFEVASVKANRSGDPTFSYFDAGEPGRYTAVNVSVRTLLREAYGLMDFQVAGGPGWLNSDRFDIVAKGDGRVPSDQTLLMLRTLLADRFQLVVHHEAQQLAVYALVLARSDGKLGQHLKPADVDCQPPRPLLNGPPDFATQCGFWYTPGGHALGRSVTLEQVAGGLSGAVGRVVLNRTGLAGAFDFDLDFTPPSRPNGIAGGAATGGGAASAGSGASIFTAIQEQLGLKLESTKGPVDVLMIDSAEPPTAD